MPASTMACFYSAPLAWYLTGVDKRVAMRVQPFVTVLQIEKSRLPHLATPRFTRLPRHNHESDFSQSGKT